MFSFSKIADSFFATILVFFIYSTSSAQVSDLPPLKEFGSFKSIESDSVFDIMFIYDGMRVSMFDTEEKFVSYIVSEKNAKKTGTGEEWFQEWTDAKKNYFEPEFTNSLNEEVKEKNKKFSQGSNSKYMLLIKTLYLEPGNKFSEFRRPPLGHFEFYFIEKSNPENVIIKLYVQDVPGYPLSSMDPDIGSRIASCYKRAGKMLGNYLMR